jgi:hypothetical protein
VLIHEIHEVHDFPSCSQDILFGPLSLVYSTFVFDGEERGRKSEIKKSSGRDGGSWTSCTSQTKGDGSLTQNCNLEVLAGPPWVEDLVHP